MAELTEVQKHAVAEWIEAGDDLAAIQEKLRTEFGLRLTFMDVRFLLLDLGMSVQDKPASRERTDLAGADGGAAAETGGAAPGAGGVRVEVDRITKPGSVVSGSVVFSDGQRAAWMLDATGRLGLNPEQEGYRPSQQDVGAFQQELQQELARQGF
ncbi:MAG: hypothetical protein JW951_02855 [Lentisphaerae bacterium]|nr:hypothetical protein [Lentisphaerota bacterium]